MDKEFNINKASQKFLLSDLLSVIEVAEILGIHPNNVSIKCRQGRIPHAKMVGRRWVIPASSIPYFGVRKIRFDKKFKKKKRGNKK